MLTGRHRTRVQAALDSEKGGRGIGDLCLHHSNAELPLDSWPVAVPSAGSS